MAAHQLSSQEARGVEPEPWCPCCRQTLEVELSHENIQVFRDYVGEFISTENTPDSAVRGIYGPPETDDERHERHISEGRLPQPGSWQANLVASGRAPPEVMTDPRTAAEFTRSRYHANDIQADIDSTRARYLPEGIELDEEQLAGIVLQQRAEHEEAAAIRRQANRERSEPHTPAPPEVPEAVPIFGGPGSQGGDGSYTGTENEDTAAHEQLVIYRAGDAQLLHIYHQNTQIQARISMIIDPGAWMTMFGWNLARQLAVKFIAHGKNPEQIKLQQPIAIAL